MSIDTSKTDLTTGQKVNLYLKSLGVETPTTSVLSQINDAEKIVELTKLYTKAWEILGLDLTDDSLSETPLRIAKMQVKEKFAGLNYENFPKATVVSNKFHYDEMLVERNITLNSICEHHGLEITGHAHVAYIPKDKVLGLSKLNRIVDFFARRPQIQERLTEQIYHALVFLLETDNVAVCIEAEHMCVKTRGIEDACSDTVTSKLGGNFRAPEVRAEFFNIISLKKGK